MTILTAFVPPEFWYVKKDIDSILWPCFAEWFFKQISKDKWGFPDCPYEYYTHDADGFFILPNQPKNVKEVSLKQWYHWYFFAEMIERSKEIGNKIIAGVIQNGGYEPMYIDLSKIPASIPDDAFMIHPP